MSYTRAGIEKTLLKRLGNLMLAADLDGTSDDGDNADLLDPLSYAARLVGVAIADSNTLTDDDLLGLAASDYDKFLDVAELRTLENIWGNYDAVDLSVGPRRESFSQLADRILKRLNTKRTDVMVKYGVGMPDATVSTAPFYNTTGDISLIL